MLAEIAEQIVARYMQQEFQKGFQIGMHQEAKEEALKMKQKGFPEEDIAEITGLSLEEIRAL